MPQNIERLKKRADFIAVKTEGRYIKTPLFVLQVLKNTRGEIRLGFTVTKKLDKRAVVRNRIRRRLKEAARLTFPLYAQQGTDYVLVGRLVGKDCPFAELKSEIQNALLGNIPAKEASSKLNKRKNHPFSFKQERNIKSS